MNPKIDKLVNQAIKLIDKNWEICDPEKGEECKGRKCKFFTHRVMIILCEILKENERT